MQAVGLSADNASSARDGVAGSMERFAKLYVPGFGARRYRVIREMVASSVDDALVLIDESTHDAAANQPHVAYAFSAEVLLSRPWLSQVLAQMMNSIENILRSPYLTKP